MKPTIGRIVHFVQKKGEGSTLVHLPAIIVAAWSDTCVNLQVFTDGQNSEGSNPPTANPASVKWVTSASLNEAADQPYSWHWPERE